jgi:hypothetical protein
MMTRTSGLFRRLSIERQEIMSSEIIPERVPTKAHPVQLEAAIAVLEDMGFAPGQLRETAQQLTATGSWKVAAKAEVDDLVQRLIVAVESEPQEAPDALLGA